MIYYIDNTNLGKTLGEALEEIRQSGIKTCVCCEFKISIGLMYSGGSPGKIHGYIGDEYTSATDALMYDRGSDDFIECSDLKEFIKRVKDEDKTSGN